MDLEATLIDDSRMPVLRLQRSKLKTNSDVHHTRTSWRVLFITAICFRLSNREYTWERSRNTACPLLEEICDWKQAAYDIERRAWLRRLTTARTPSSARH